MRRITLVVGVLACIVAAMMAFAGPAFAGIDGGSCIHVPLSPLATGATPMTFSALLTQLAVAVGVVMVVAVALSPVLTVLRPGSVSGTRAST
jgi:hypothetical protein